MMKLALGLEGALVHLAHEKYSIALLLPQDTFSVMELAQVL